MVKIQKLMEYKDFILWLYAFVFLVIFNIFKIINILGLCTLDISKRSFLLLVLIILIFFIFNIYKIIMNRGDSDYIRSLLLKNLYFILFITLILMLVNSMVFYSKNVEVFEIKFLAIKLNKVVWNQAELLLIYREYTSMRLLDSIILSTIKDRVIQDPSILFSEFDIILSNLTKSDSFLNLALNNKGKTLLCLSLFLIITVGVPFIVSYKILSEPYKSSDFISKEVEEVLNAYSFIKNEDLVEQIHSATGNLQVMYDHTIGTILRSINDPGGILFGNRIITNALVSGENLILETQGLKNSMNQAFINNAMDSDTIAEHHDIFLRALLYVDSTGHPYHAFGL